MSEHIADFIPSENNRLSQAAEIRLDLEKQADEIAQLLSTARKRHQILLTSVGPTTVWRSLKAIREFEHQQRVTHELLGRVALTEYEIRTAIERRKRLTLDVYIRKNVGLFEAMGVCIALAIYSSTSDNRIIHTFLPGGFVVIAALIGFTLFALIPFPNSQTDSLLQLFEFQVMYVILISILGFLLASGLTLPILILILSGQMWVVIYCARRYSAFRRRLPFPSDQRVRLSDIPAILIYGAMVPFDTWIASVLSARIEDSF